MGVWHEASNQIDRAWDQQSAKVDWLGLETTLRLILREAGGELPPTLALGLIAEAVEAYTRRGPTGYRYTPRDPNTEGYGA